MAAWKNKLYFFDYKNFQKCINIGKKDYSVQHTHSIYANILLLLLSNIDLQIGTCFSNGEGNGNPPVFLPGKFHGQRNLEGCSPWGCKESDTTEQLPHTHAFPKTYLFYLFFCLLCFILNKNCVSGLLKSLHKHHLNSYVTFHGLLYHYSIFRHSGCFQKLYNYK